MDEAKGEDIRPSALATRLDRVLAEGERLIALVPEAQIDYRSRTTDRPLRDIAYQMFRQSLAFVDALDRGHLASSWLEENAPLDLDDGRAIARYGALVRGRLAGWFEGAGPAEYSREIDVDHGRELAQDLLERTTRRATELLHQLRAAIRELGLTPTDIS
jgi:hypothetical protein